MAALADRIDSTTGEQVRRALAMERPGPKEVAALVSPASRAFLPEIERRARQVTLHRFGRVVQLFAPLYLSNRCTNRCAYCGFAADSDIRRADLTPVRALENARILHEQGFRHVLLVTGEDPAYYGAGDIEAVVRVVSDLFHSISIEVFPMSAQDYAHLAAAGVDGLTLYQETYDLATYAAVHLGGRKRSYEHRLEAMEHGGGAGFRTLGIGALLGLSFWRTEAVVLAMHAAYLSRRFWRSRVALSFPRLVDAGRGFPVAHPVSDDDLSHMMCALRLALPDAEMVVSTREPAWLRDRLVGLAVTRMSAGSRTSPDGYITSGAGQQFSVLDDRTPAQVADMLALAGYDPVFKDLDRALRAR